MNNEFMRELAKTLELTVVAEISALDMNSMFPKYGQLLALVMDASLDFVESRKDEPEYPILKEMVGQIMDDFHKPMVITNMAVEFITAIEESTTHAEIEYHFLFLQGAMEDMLVQYFQKTGFIVTEQQLEEVRENFEASRELTRPLYEEAIRRFVF